MSGVIIYGQNRKNEKGSARGEMVRLLRCSSCGCFLFVGESFVMDLKLRVREYLCR